MKSLFTVMPLRYSRFYLSGYPHYYGHIRLPQQQNGLFCPVRVSHVHALPFPARNRILPRVFPVVHIVVYPNRIAGFSISDRLANTIGVTRLDYSSLQNRNSLNSVRLVSLPHIRGTLTRTTNLVTWLFHPLGI